MSSFNGNLFAKPNYELREPAFVQELAMYFVGTELSAGMLYALIEGENYSYHVGNAFNSRDELLDLDALDPMQLWGAQLLARSKILNRMRFDLWSGRPWGEIRFEMGDLFGYDRKGTMNKFIRYATTPPKRALSEHLVPRMMFLDFTRTIRTERLRSVAEVRS